MKKLSGPVQSFFKIPTFKVIDGNCFIDQYTLYNINFFSGSKPTKLRLVVNGYITKIQVSITNRQLGYKKLFLKAIQEYEEVGVTNPNRVKKVLTYEKIKFSYSQRTIPFIQKHLLIINKCDERDLLAQYNLLVVDESENNPS